MLLRGREPVGENKPGIQGIGIWARIWSVSKARSQAFRNRCSIHTSPTLHRTGFDYEMFWNVQTERVVFVQRNRGPHPWLLLTLLLSLWGKKAVTFVFWVLVSVWEGRRGENVNVKNGKEGWIPFSLPPEESFLYLSCLFLSCVCVLLLFFLPLGVTNSAETFFVPKRWFFPRQQSEREWQSLPVSSPCCLPGSIVEAYGCRAQGGTGPVWLLKGLWVSLELKKANLKTSRQFTQGSEFILPTSTVVTVSVPFSPSACNVVLGTSLKMDLAPHSLECSKEFKAQSNLDL